jgi:hypothetical protein
MKRYMRLAILCNLRSAPPPRDDTMRWRVGTKLEDIRNAWSTRENERAKASIRRRGKDAGAAVGFSMTDARRVERER